MKTVNQYDFADVFNFATRVYGISWNPCNDVFFGNSLTYHSVTDYYIEEWIAYTDLWDDSRFQHPMRASELSKRLVGKLSDSDKSYVILSAYFESLGVSGEVQIDCR